MEPAARLKTATLQLSTHTCRTTPLKYSKACWWHDRKCSIVSARVNSRYILRLKASTMMKKERRRWVDPTGTEPAQSAVCGKTLPESSAKRGCGSSHVQ